VWLHQKARHQSHSGEAADARSSFEPNLSIMSVFSGHGRIDIPFHIYNFDFSSSFNWLEWGKRKNEQHH